MSHTMKSRFFSRFSFLIIILICLSDTAFAQLGYSSASMSMGRQRSELYIIPQPSEIVVAEYYNYHKHNINLPQNGKSVNLDLRLGNPRPGKNGILQVGISTTTGDKYYEAPAVNIGLVIDRSGSMQGEKLQKTKKALLTMVNHLKPDDKISIIAFDHEAQVLLPAQEVGNKFMVRSAINNLQTRGSTDLNRGIITGYEELIKTYAAQQSNRLIILTDAMTNTGELSPEKIVANSHQYDASLDIDYVFIGVGMDVNYELARQLTSSKSNTFHFIDNAEDIEKVFDNEVASLLYPVGKNAELTIEFPDHVMAMGSYDFAYDTRNKNSMTFSLNNMNQGLTQVVLTDFQMNQYRQGNITARLSYDNVATGERETIVNTIALSPGDEHAAFITDTDILKNETIAMMAIHLKRMAEYIHDHKNKKAADLEISNGLSLAKERFPRLKDADVKRVYNILEKYQSDLEHYTER